MTDLKKVYVFLINYNSWEDTIECLQSLINVNYKPINIIGFAFNISGEVLVTIITFTIKATKETTSESENKINTLKTEINHKNSLVEIAYKKLKPLRDKNIEILSKLQRLNLEFQNLEDEEKRTKSDKERLLKSKNTLEEDIERERNIIFEAKSNEKRLEEEKSVLIKTEKEYYDLEKQTENDLRVCTDELKKQQAKLLKL